MKSKILQYNVIFKPEPEGGFTAFAPSLPGCITYGRDLKEAQKMIVDAIRGYIQSLNKHNEQVPTDVESFVSLISLSSPKVH